MSIPVALSRQHSRKEHRFTSPCTRTTCRHTGQLLELLALDAHVTSPLVGEEPAHRRHGRIYRGSLRLVLRTLLQHAVVGAVLAGGNLIKHARDLGVALSCTHVVQLLELLGLELGLSLLVLPLGRHLGPVVNLLSIPIDVEGRVVSAIIAARDLVLVAAELEVPGIHKLVGALVGNPEDVGPLPLVSIRGRPVVIVVLRGGIFILLLRGIVGPLAVLLLRSVLLVRVVFVVGVVRIIICAAIRVPAIPAARIWVRPAIVATRVGVGGVPSVRVATGVRVL